METWTLVIYFFFVNPYIDNAMPFQISMIPGISTYEDCKVAQNAHNNVFVDNPHPAFKQKYRSDPILTSICIKTISKMVQ